MQLIGTFGAWIVRLVVATLRFRVRDDAGVIGGPATPRLIWAFWHNSLFVIPHLQNRYLSHRPGAALTLEMKRLIEQGFDVAITPDGPRGPRYHLNPGVITLAQKTGALIMPIRVHYSRCWRLKTWDAFEIPKPFATVTIALLPLYRVAPASGDKEFEPERARLERILREPVAASDVH